MENEKCKMKRGMEADEEMPSWMKHGMHGSAIECEGHQIITI
jgi:hypothetical protein